MRPPTFDDIVTTLSLDSSTSAVKHVEKLHDLIREQRRWFPHKQVVGVAEKSADVISDLGFQRTKKLHQTVINLEISTLNFLKLGNRDR